MACFALSSNKTLAKLLLTSRGVISCSVEHSLYTKFQSLFFFLRLFNCTYVSYTISSDLKSLQ